MLTQSHSLREFDTALNSIASKVLRMFSHAEFSLDLVAQGLLGRDEDSANQTIAEDEDLDELELAVDKETMSFLACFAPVAGDLRLVLTLSRLSAQLERMGDECVSMAKRIKKLNKSTEIRETRFAEPVLQLLRHDLAHIHQLFEQKNMIKTLNEGEKSVIRTDATSALTRRFTELSDHPDISIISLAELIFISRSFERISEGITKIAEEILYIETAQRNIASHA